MGATCRGAESRPNARAGRTIEGSFGNFVASRGQSAQPGFATAEPFQYDHEIKQWAKPVAYQLIADTRIQPVSGPRGEAGQHYQYADCFTLRVTMLQQSEINYLANPGRVDQLLSSLTTKYGGAPYTTATADCAVKVQVRKGLIGNIPGTGLGEIDLAGLQKQIAIAGPIFAAQKNAPAPGLTLAEIATNRFIDPAIQLPTP